MRSRLQSAGIIQETKTLLFGQPQSTDHAAGGTRTEFTAKGIGKGEPGAAQDQTGQKPKEKNQMPDAYLRPPPTPPRLNDRKAQMAKF